jgi:hypothetical protein
MKCLQRGTDWGFKKTCLRLDFKRFFTTEMKRVYSAVRTGDLNKAVCDWALNGFYNRDELFTARYGLGI